MHAASAAAGVARSATARLPAVVGRPATSMMSLTATRSPGPGAVSLTIHVDIGDQLAGYGPSVSGLPAARHGPGLPRPSWWTVARGPRKTTVSGTIAKRPVPNGPP